MKKLLGLAFCLLFTTVLTAQETTAKKKIDHTLYDSWNTIGSILQSQSGELITYSINPSQGDGTFFIEKIDGSLKKSFERGKRPNIHFKENFVVFQIAPQFDTVRQLKLDKVKNDKLPKDSLGIYWPATDSLRTFEKIKSYQISEEGDWIAYLSTEDLREDCPEGKKKKKKKKKKKDDCTKPKTSGKTLTVYNPVDGREKVLHEVVSYDLNRSGTSLVYTTSLKGDKDTLTVHILDLASFSSTALAEKQLAVSNLTFDYHGKQLAFLATPDTNEKKNFNLHLWSGQDSKVIVDSLTSGMPEGWTVSEFGKPRFSRDGSKLFLGTNEIVRQDPEDTLLDSEKAKVDVWGGNDPRIQPEQLKRKKQDERHNYLAVYHITSSKFVQLESEKLEYVYLSRHANSNFAFGSTEQPYLKERTWTYPWREDYYWIDLESGMSGLLAKALYSSASLSPSGEYFVWYDVTDSSWYGKHINDREAKNLSASISAKFASDNNGQPSYSWSYGSNGWTQIDGHEYMIINSEYDVWAVSPANPKKVVEISGATGVKENVRYRITRKERDSAYVDLEQCLLHGVDQKTKAESYSNFQLDVKDRKFVRTELIRSDHEFVYFSKAKKSDQILFRRASFTDYPNLESATDNFQNPKTLTDANPQQADYNWGTVEFVEWKSFKGLDLRGLLYKPEDFDSTKSYPMIVYYYEKYQDRFHTYYPPRATASIIYPTEYVSNGYIVFIPDILYEPGHPAQSAYDCIVSGTDYLTEKYDWIDTTKMGLQGQSWGGYQTAQLVTMTNKYSAAMAGAPVSNMFSAYGGIRWGSGLSRMFQYENTQSRIGHTIWERPDLYIENSPVFHLPNVETPLLIMHNDGDGAVPWYQGIELFMGLRRLDQPVWMLNYNGDAHNLTKLANKKDLSIRMRQFFDYYLLDAPAPKWMEEGVPATDKGKNYGLELINSDQKAE
jgi:dipeptidyl aminopeptidase/acylaminoacyl peptidase